MSRFYPAILAADTLKKMGTDLETIATKVRERNWLTTRLSISRVELYSFARGSYYSALHLNQQRRSLSTQR